MELSQTIIQSIFLLLNLLISRTRGLKLVRLDVPAIADIFSPVTLKCEYNLEDMNLYSVKWYKDGFEFFRYMPDYDPRSQALKSSGITVDLQKSDMNQVTLINLQFNHTGNYKCEVSTEAPDFKTVAQHANMTVMAYPTEDPKVEGVLSTYSLGDYVYANCTSGKSSPPAILTWHINGAKPDTWSWDNRRGWMEKDSQGLYTRTVGLQFQILSSHFTSNGGGLMPKMEIRCTSTIGNSVRHKAVYPTLVRALTSNSLAQKRLTGSAGVLRPPISIALVLVTSFRT
ncbi:hypothetical protein L9F63_002688, partial [Diploptera punctata]